MNNEMMRTKVQNTHEQVEVWASRGGVEIMLDSVSGAALALERCLS